MKKLLVFPLMFLLSCEWQPDRVSVADITSYQAMNLALNDTTKIALPGSNLQVNGSADESIVQIELLTDSTITLVGVGTGETSVILSYTNQDLLTAIVHVKVLVSDGILLNLYYSEPQAIELADYISEADMNRIDTIQTTITGTESGIELTADLDSGRIDLFSLHDGKATIDLVAFDSTGVLVASLIFKTETIVRRITLAEIFTNAGCVNCPTANENLDHLYEEYPEDFTAIRYHVFWTDPNDPMNLYNPVETETRREFYGNSYEAPRLFMNGMHESAFDELQTLSNKVGQNISLGSKTHISYTGLATSFDSVFVDIQIKNFDQAYDHAICWSVLTEDSIYYVGTNGETIHNQAMRDMTFSELTIFSEEVSLSHSVKLPPNVVLDDKFHLVTFIQDGGSNEIIQAIDRALPEID